MTEIIVNGKCPTYITKEEVRAIVLATITVMAFHKHYLKRPQEGVKVCITQRPLGRNRLNPESENGGVAWRGLGMFKIKRGIMNKPAFTTILIHESIHLCESWGDSDEFIVSTLTDRLKESIVEIAEELASNTYRRAACFAHTNPNMAYHKLENEDCYNDEQWNNKKTTSGNKSIAA